MVSINSLFKRKAEENSDPSEEEIIANIGADIPKWDNLIELHFQSTRMRLDRAHNIQRFVLHHGQDITDRADRRLYLTNAFRDEQAVAGRILRTLKFSSKLETMMLNMVEKTVEDIQLDHGDNFLPVFQSMSAKQKYKVLDNVMKTFISHITNFIPGLKMPELQLGIPKTDALGWMYMSEESLKSGNFGAAYLNKGKLKETTFPTLVDAIIHEATHIALAQLASMHHKNNIRLVPEVARDMNIIIESIKLDFHPSSSAYEIYRNDPQEAIAFTAGNYASHILLCQYLGKPKPPEHFITPDDIILPEPVASPLLYRSPWFG